MKLKCNDCYRDEMITRDFRVVPIVLVHGRCQACREAIAEARADDRERLRVARRLVARAAAR